ncbi:MAG TPA: hypothetical protein VM070_01415 [Candidatus Saccharimonadales bacterium]|nr:hypothetical protein [Candidatus Saccharimonadales bacterium]
MSGSVISGQRGAVAGAILLGILWSVGAIEQIAPQPDRMALLFAGLVLLWIHLRGAGNPALACYYAFLVGASERIARLPLTDASDVMRATTEAIETLLQGGNPYAHVMQSTIPVGSPFVYPPGEIALYLPSYLLVTDITRVDTITGILSIGLIALAGQRAGWDRVALPAMLYATWGVGAFRAVDGSNDVSGAFLVICGLVALVFADPRTRVGRVAYVVSAVALGWAMAFKQFAVVIVPLVIRHLAVSGRDWRRYAAISFGTAAAFVLPFLLWDPQAFIGQQLATFTFHQDLWGINLLNLIAQYQDVAPVYPLFFAAEVLLTLIGFGFALRVRFQTIGRAAIAGCGVILIALFLARWSTQPYFIYIGAVACTALALADHSARAAENLESAR